MGKNKNPLGITVKKSEDFSEWYTQLLQKAELIEYSAVSGCYILSEFLPYLGESAGIFQ